MPNIVVVGLQWGNEGKGKIVDYLSEKADLVARYQGGHNAGHTVVINNEKFILHLIPSGILYKGKKCLIGDGVVVHPASLIQEINGLKARGVEISGNLFISKNAHVIMTLFQGACGYDRRRLRSGREIEALMMNLKNLFQRAVELAPYLTRELGSMVSNIKSPPILADLIASHLNISTPEKQGILETIDVRERLTKVHLILHKEVQVLELGNKIQSQVKEDMDRTQREYYLREQLKAIQRELGEVDEQAAEVEEFRQKIEQASMPEEAAKPKICV